MGTTHVDGNSDGSASETAGLCCLSFTSHPRRLNPVLWFGAIVFLYPFRRGLNERSHIGNCRDAMSPASSLKKLGRRDHINAIAGGKLLLPQSKYQMNRQIDRRSQAQQTQPSHKSAGGQDEQADGISEGRLVYIARPDPTNPVSFPDNPWFIKHRQLNRRQSNLIST